MLIERVPLLTAPRTLVCLLAVTCLVASSAAAANTTVAWKPDDLRKHLVDLPVIREVTR